MDNRKDLDDEVDKILRDARAKKAAEEAAKAANAENAGNPAEDIPAPQKGGDEARSDEAAEAKAPAEPAKPTEPAAEPISAPEYKPSSLAAKAVDEEDESALAETEEDDADTPEKGKKNRNRGKKAKGEKKEKRKLSTLWKIVIIVVAVIVVVAAALGIIALVTDDNPVTYTTAVVTNSENKLIANWENEEYPDRYAYTFNEDGTYQEYLGAYSFDYEYEATATHLTLRNPQIGLEEVYKYTISGDTLKLTLVEQYGKEIEDGETKVYHKVDTLNMADIADLADNL